MLRTTLLPVLASFVLFACGGSVESVPDPNGSSSTSGSSSGGSGTSKRDPNPTNGGAKATTGSEGQCDGIPECNPGWTEVKGCVPDSECEKITTCGVSIVCQKIDATCEGTQPICDPGDVEVEGKSACPQDAKCYSRSNNCNVTIWCTSN